MPGSILLTIDVEEFDAPQDFGTPIPWEQQMERGVLGFQRVLRLLEESQRSSTLFVTASFAEAAPELVRIAAATHEIASHGLTHGALRPGDAAQSRRVLGTISGQPIMGFRRARMQATGGEELVAAGYRWDSSVNPIWLPGRYNNLRLPRSITVDGGLIEVPASATPILRIPLFWLAVKNLPLALMKSAAQRCLACDGYVMLYFHPWEFTDLRGTGLPRYMTRVSGEQMVDRLSELMASLERQAKCARVSDYLEQKGLLRCGVAMEAAKT